MCGAETPDPPTGHAQDGSAAVAPGRGSVSTSPPLLQGENSQGMAPAVLSAAGQKQAPVLPSSVWSAVVLAQLPSTPASASPPWNTDLTGFSSWAKVMCVNVSGTSAVPVQLCLPTHLDEGFSMIIRSVDTASGAERHSVHRGLSDSCSGRYRAWVVRRTPVTLWAARALPRVPLSVCILAPLPSLRQP